MIDMNAITPFINESGTIFLAQDTGLIRRLQEAGFQAGASLFNEYSGDNASAAYVLAKDGFENSEITVNPEKAKRLESKGWQVIDTFKVSLSNDDGTRKIKQAIDPVTNETLYVTRDVAKNLKSSGFDIDGKAWFAPANDGETDILKSIYDPVTGKILIAYKIDPLFLQQFNNLENKMSVMVTAVHGDGRSSEDTVTHDIDIDAAGKRAIFKGNVKDILPARSDASDIEELFVSLNTKFGNDRESPEAFGLVRTSSLEFSPKSGRLKVRNNTGGTRDIDATNFFEFQAEETFAEEGFSRNSYAQENDDDPQPGRTYNGIRIEGKRLKGADWSNVLFLDSGIYGNTLDYANFSGLRAHTDIRRKNNINIPYYTTWGWQGQSGPNSITHTNLSNASFELPSAKWNEVTDYIGDLTGSYGQYKMTLSFPFSPTYEATAIVVSNTGGKTAYVDGRSAQMSYGKSPSEPFLIPKDFQLQISGYAKYSSSSDMDQITNLTVNGANYRLSTDNPALSAASLYLDGSEVGDTGSSPDGAISWSFQDIRDMKIWFVNIN